MIQKGRSFLRRRFTSLSYVLLVCACLVTSVHAAPAAEKEWTVLVYLNGNNSLDEFGAQNIEMMEKVGSTDQFNIVVQWASEASTVTKRLLVKKSNNPSAVTSPVVQSLPRVDMGDYNSLVDFAKWGIANYPAKHYFVDVWNHGNGWHRMPTGLPITHDISYDDVSGNHFTTPQFGTALSQISDLIGHKIDLVGTDACLMAMVEVASEMADSAQYLVASQDVEPGLGWPYDTFLQDWVTSKSNDPKVIGGFLVKEYVKLYTDQQQEVLFSMMDLSKQADIETSIANVASNLKSLSAADQKTAMTAANATLHFTNPDYADLGDLIAHFQGMTHTGMEVDPLTSVVDSLKGYIADNATTSTFTAAKGVSIWWPDSADTYHQYSDYYDTLKFAKTGWGDMLKVYFP